MARASARMITREVSVSKKLPLLSRDALILFFLLIPHQDSHGKMNGDPCFIKGEVCPRFPWFTPRKIEACLREISGKTNVKWFRKDGLWYIHALNFSEHQPGLRPDRAGRDVYPNWPGEDIDGAEEVEPGPGPVRTGDGVSPEPVRSEGEGEGEGEVEKGCPASRRTPPAPVKPVKLVFGEYRNVRLTEEEHGRLEELFGEKTTSEYVESLSGHIESKGERYKSHYATVRNWLRRDKVEPRLICTASSPMSGSGPKDETEGLRWSHPETIEVKHRETGAAARKCLHCGRILPP